MNSDEEPKRHQRPLVFRFCRGKRTAAILWYQLCEIPRYEQLIDIVIYVQMQGCWQYWADTFLFDELT